MSSRKTSTIAIAAPVAAARVGARGRPRAKQKKRLQGPRTASSEHPASVIIPAMPHRSTYPSPPAGVEERETALGDSCRRKMQEREFASAGRPTSSAGRRSSRKLLDMRMRSRPGSHEGALRAHGVSRAQAVSNMLGWHNYLHRDPVNRSHGLGEDPPHQTNSRAAGACPANATAGRRAGSSNKRRRVRPPCDSAIRRPARRHIGAADMELNRRVQMKF